MKASKKTPMSRLLKGLRERAKQALSWPAASAAATAARPKALLALPAPPIMVSGADQEQEQEQQQSALMPPLVDSALADDSLADINNGDLHAADNTSATADDFPATADDALATDGDALATDGDAPTAADNGTATADDDDDDDNNDAVLDIFKLFATAQEKMEAEGNDKMIDFIADHLEAMSGRTPLAGSILACLKTFANSGQATHPAIGELYHRVIFVLDLLCHLDKKTNWSKRKSHAVAVLALLEDPIRVCSVLLLAHQQLWFNRQCHGESINNKIKDCDKMLTSALTKVAFLLDLTVVGTLPAIPVTVEFDSVEVGALVVMPQAVELEVAANALPLGEQTFEQGAAAAAADVHPSFDEQFQALDNGFNFAPMEVALLAKTELATLGKHGHRLPPSPPTPPPKDRQLYRKRSSKLDLDADMPNPTLTGTARDIDDATGKVAEAGQEAFQLADYYKEAQEKLDGTEISDTIGAVLGHFQSIANSVPFAGPIFACFKIFVDCEIAAKDGGNAIRDLYHRVVFVLDTVRQLDKKHRWSTNNITAMEVLRPLKIPIRSCSALFSAYKERNWLNRRLHANETLKEIKELDEKLTKAMKDSAWVLKLGTTFKLPAVSTAFDEETAAVVAAVNKLGGIEAILASRTTVAALGEKLKLLGEQFDLDTLLDELKCRFDERFNELDKSFEDVLTVVAAQGKSIDEAKVMLDELSKRNSFFMEIKTSALRDLWQRAGWSARVKMPEFTDVLVDQVRVEVGRAIAGSGRSAKEPEIAADLHALYDGFAKVLQGIDDDKSGTVSPHEINKFFKFQSWGLLDYFTLVSFFMKTMRGELLNSLEHQLNLIWRRLMTQDKGSDFALLFDSLRPTIAAMRDLAHKQSEVDCSLPDWLDPTSKKKPSTLDKELSPMYERRATCKKLGAWGWKRMAKYAPPSFANLHAMFDQAMKLAAALEGGIEVFKWAKFEVAIREFEKYVSEWTPELAEHLKKVVDAALVWHGDGKLLGGDAHHNAKHFEITSNRPFPRVAVMKHTARRPPPNAIIGGTIGGEALYLASTVYRNLQGESYGYATYARDVAGEISCASCAPDSVTEFSWLVMPAVHDAMSNITKPSKGILQWVSQSLATAPHPLAGVINIEWSTSPIYIARYKRDANTILPGYLYIDDGALHFVCTLVTNDRDRVIFSTQTAAELRFPNDTVDTTFEPLLGSELAAIELLISAPSQFPLYKEVQWSHPDHLGACSPLVMNITTAGPIRLAWCLGNSGVYLGTHVENTNFASYYEPGPDDVDSKHTIAKSFKFWLLTGQQHQYKQFESNCSAPHPALEWQRQRQGNFKDVTVVQFASSGGNMVVVQPRGTSSNLGLDFVTTGTDTALIVLVKLNNTVARRDINGRITLDEISSEGDTTALNWWFEVDLPPVYSTKAVDESSANNHTKTLDWWFNFSTDNNMPFHFTDAAVDKAAEKGSLDSLKWWFGKYGTTMRFSRAAIDGAIGNGQLDVIRWWVDNGLPFQPTPYALNQASKNGHVDFFATWHSKLLDLDFNANSTTCMDYATSGRQTLVLDWFKDHAPDSYSANAVHWAAKAGHTDMLQWWLDSGLPLKYLDTTYQEAHYDAQVWWHEIGFSKLPRNPVPGNAGHQLPRTPVLNNKAIKKEELAIDRASRANRVTTLKELLKARPLGRYSANAVDYASANGHLDVLKIWKSSGCAMVYTQRAMDFASARGHLEVLSWWMMSGLELLYSKAAMDKASGRIESNGVQSEQVSIAVLDWWLASGLPILYSASAMINSSQAGFVDVLSWWSVHKFRIYFRDKALIQASRHGRIRALEWWRDNGFDLKVCRDVCIAEATSAGQEEVVVWWQSAVSLHELCP